MLSRQVVFKGTTGLPSSDERMAWVDGVVDHVGLCIISRGIAHRETFVRRGTKLIVNVNRSPPEDQLPVIHISSIQPNVLLLDCKIKGIAVSAVIDCCSSICILSNGRCAQLYSLR